MKTIYYLPTLLLILGFQNKNFANTAYHDQPVVIVCENRVHLLLDETPNAPIVLELRDDAGRVWHTDTFTLESEYWFTEMPALPAGAYSLFVDDVRVSGFSKQTTDASYFVKKTPSK